MKYSTLQKFYCIDDQYNVVEIAKAAAVAAGNSNSTESTNEVKEEVINRAAGDGSGQEKRKAEEMGDGMDVDAPKADGAEDRASKQLKVDQE